MSTIDWPAIREKFEQGISQRTLARRYGVNQASISRRANKEAWNINPRITPASERISDALPEKPPETLAEAVEALIQKVIVYAQRDNLEVKDVKLLADAISQFHKIRLTSPSTQQFTESGFPADLLTYLTTDQLAEIAQHRQAMDEVLEVAKARKLEAEQGIHTLRKMG